MEERMKTAALRTSLFLCGVAAVGCTPTLPSNEPLFFSVVNLEQVNPANNLAVPGYAPASGQQGNWGVFNIPMIRHGVVVTPNVDIGPGATTFFVDDGPGGSAGQITGIFYGIQNTSPTTSTGGTMDFFWHAANASYVTASCLSGATCAPDAPTVALFTSGTFLARVKLASGVDSGNAMTFTKSDIAFTSPSGIGHASSFADVDTTNSGAWTAALDGNWFTTSFGTRDIRLLTVFTGGAGASWSGGPAGTVGLRSNDPFRVFTH
jgi:hypothetical protein